MPLSAMPFSMSRAMSRPVEAPTLQGCQHMCTVYISERAHEFDSLVSNDLNCTAESRDLDSPVNERTESVSPHSLAN